MSPCVCVLIEFLRQFFWILRIIKSLIDSFFVSRRQREYLWWFLPTQDKLDLIAFDVLPNPLRAEKNKKQLYSITILLFCFFYDSRFSFFSKKKRDTAHLKFPTIYWQIHINVENVFFFDFKIINKFVFSCCVAYQVR
jgi:hypothetical protein